MMNPRELICPVSDERVNERVVRFNALFTIILITAGIYFRSPLVWLLMLADFYIRAFTALKSSPVSYFSQGIVSWLRLAQKPIDKAPKIFAARLGFLMVLTAVVLYFASLISASLVVAGILVFFASLELFAGFCAGCYIYSYVVLPLATRK